MSNAEIARNAGFQGRVYRHFPGIHIKFNRESVAIVTKTPDLYANYCPGECPPACSKSPIPLSLLHSPYRFTHLNDNIRESGKSSRLGSVAPQDIQEGYDFNFRRRTRQKKDEGMDEHGRKSPPAEVYREYGLAKFASPPDPPDKRKKKGANDAQLLQAQLDYEGHFTRSRRAWPKNDNSILATSTPADSPGTTSFKIHL